MSLAVCSQVPLRCVKTAFVTQGLGNRELVKNFCVPSLGHIREASARPCGQPHWSTRCLTLLKQSESYTYVWCMFQTFMPVQGEGGAPVSMSDTFSKLIVCLTAGARPSILCFFDPFVEVALPSAGCQCKRFRQPSGNDLWVWQSVAKYLWGVSRQLS